MHTELILYLKCFLYLQWMMFNHYLMMRLFCPLNRFDSSFWIIHRKKKQDIISHSYFIHHEITLLHLIIFFSVYCSEVKCGEKWKKNEERSWNTTLLHLPTSCVRVFCIQIMWRRYVDTQGALNILLHTPNIHWYTQLYINYKSSIKCFGKMKLYRHKTTK